MLSRHSIVKRFKSTSSLCCLFSNTKALHLKTYRPPFLRSFADRCCRAGSGAGIGVDEGPGTMGGLGTGVPSPYCLSRKSCLSEPRASKRDSWATLRLPYIVTVEFHWLDLHWSSGTEAATCNVFQNRLCSQNWTDHLPICSSIWVFLYSVTFCQIMAESCQYWLHESQPLNVNAGRILPGFDRKLRNVGKLDCLINFKLFRTRVHCGWRHFPEKSWISVWSFSRKTVTLEETGTRDLLSILSVSEPFSSVNLLKRRY